MKITDRDRLWLRLESHIYANQYDLGIVTGQEVAIARCVLDFMLDTDDGLLATHNAVAEAENEKAFGKGDTFATAMAETADALDDFIIAAEDATKDKPTPWGGETVMIRVRETDASRQIGALMREGEERRARKRKERGNV